MGRFRSFAVLFVIAGVAFDGLRAASTAEPDDVPAASSSSSICTSTLPGNLDAGPFEQQALHMLRRSATFRRQCQRVAASKVLIVRFVLTTHRSDMDRASAVVRKYDTGAIRADVVIRFSTSYVELIAHELEHVIEQVDGVDLRAEQQAGRASEVDSGAFETERAVAAGLQVQAEWEQSGARPRTSAAVQPGIRAIYNALRRR